MHVTGTITISLRSCYHWQGFSGIVVRSLARHRKSGGWGGGSHTGGVRWQGEMGSEEEVGGGGVTVRGGNML